MKVIESLENPPRRRFSSYDRACTRCTRGLNRVRSVPARALTHKVTVCLLSSRSGHLPLKILEREIRERRVRAPSRSLVTGYFCNYNNNVAAMLQYIRDGYSAAGRRPALTENYLRRCSDFSQGRRSRRWTRNDGTFQEIPRGGSRTSDIKRTSEKKKQKKSKPDRRTLIDRHSERSASTSTMFRASIGQKGRRGSSDK